MKVVTQEKLPKSQVSFEIEVEGEASQRIYDRTVKELMSSVQVPGFRKGKAPKQLVLRQVGTAQIKSGILEEVISDSLKALLKEQEDLKVVGNFELATPIEELVARFTFGQPLTFKATVDVQPEVTLSSYQGFTVQAEKIEPDPTKVDKTLHEFQLKHSTLIPVEDRGAQPGDVVTITFTGTNPEDGSEIPDASAEDLQVDLNESEFIPGLIEGLVGMTIGETKRIDVTLPDNYYQAEYAGKPAAFSVTLEDLKTRELPPLDDEFARRISQKETMAELREFLEDRIVREAQEKTENNTDAAILTALANAVDVDLPETLIDNEVNFLLQQQADYLQRSQEGTKLAKQLFTREFVGEMRRYNEPEAIARLKRSFGLAQVAKLEGITATSEEIRQRAAEVLDEVGDRDIDRARLQQFVEDEIVNQKVLEWLKAHATIEYVPEGTLQKPEAELPEEATVDVGSESVEVDEASPET